ncbi:hypothetical protein BSKO_08769 [Bryopsis sp. KO-2023]|nr:hypothetical protein BSKO_08769 [Bryopsis sp. KO-2023]
MPVLRAGDFGNPLGALRPFWSARHCLHGMQQTMGLLNAGQDQKGLMGTPTSASGSGNPNRTVDGVGPGQPFLGQSNLQVPQMPSPGLAMPETVPNSHEGLWQCTTAGYRFPGVPKYLLVAMFGALIIEASDAQMYDWMIEV